MSKLNVSVKNKSTPQKDILENSNLHTQDRSIDSALRPTRFDDYVGQSAVKQNLLVAIAASQGRQEPLEHILLSGPPGLGKTTLAHLVAHSMGANLRYSSGPSLARTGDVAALLSTLEQGDVLFVDEIHRLPSAVEELLYPVMEDFRLDIVVGAGPGARTLRLDIPPFTLVGATTRPGALSGPLRDRFGHSYRLEYYTPDELATILKRSSKLLDVNLEPAAFDTLSLRARGVPRVANRLLKRVRDLSQVRKINIVNQALVEETLKMLSIDAQGLDTMDRRLLSVMIDQFDGGPVGIDSLAAALSEDRGTIEDIYEPFLLQKGMLARTRSGRVATPEGYAHLGKKPSGRLL